MKACWAPRARHRGGRRLRRPSRSTGPARTPAGKGRSGPASSASQAAASRSLPAEASGPRAPPKHSSSRRGPALTHFPASPPAEIHAAAEQPALFPPKAPRAALPTKLVSSILDPPERRLCIFR
ncbi:translation initiation factor IF-2-like isoform X1 [Balaenoptera musculus]|uniref:Translation initiation factor IF-2-like isoform X1 n=1 Tax=Balaenoptera musculus TaxID=9771 RepID=A0A8B8WT99_BALMU|nr:translation initiation factor IF-2-like isoform X1 [Balaenoptera musculus]